MSNLVTLLPLAALAAVLFVALVVLSRYWARGVDMIAITVVSVTKRSYGAQPLHVLALLRAEVADLLDLPTDVVTARVDYVSQAGPICGVVVTLRTDCDPKSVLDLESAVRRELPAGVTFRIDVRPVPTDTVRLSSGAA